MAVSSYLFKDRIVLGSLAGMITHINPNDDPNFRFAALFVHQFFGLLTTYLIYHYSDKEHKKA